MMVKWGSLGWLIENGDNHVKTIEGNYDNDRENRSAPTARAPVNKYIETPTREEDLPTPADIEAAKLKAGLVKTPAPPIIEPVVPVEDELPV